MSPAQGHRRPQREHKTDYNEARKGGLITPLRDQARAGRLLATAILLCVMALSPRAQTGLTGMRDWSPDGVWRL